MAYLQVIFSNIAFFLYNLGLDIYSFQCWGLYVHIFVSSFTIKLIISLKKLEEQFSFLHLIF
jgi:hypothetical protein